VSGAKDLLRCPCGSLRLGFSAPGPGDRLLSMLHLRDPSSDRTLFYSSALGLVTLSSPTIRVELPSGARIFSVPDPDATSALSEFIGLVSVGSVLDS